MIKTYFYNAEPPKRQRNSEPDQKQKEEMLRNKKPKRSPKQLSINTSLHASPFASRYSIHELIGRGAQGKVWLAIDKQSQHRVAIKQIPLNSRSSMQAARHEIHALRAFNSDYIVKLLRGFRHMGYCLICTEYLSGGDLFSVVDRPDVVLSEVHLKKIMFELFSAIRYAHDRKIAHLDIKLDNIVLTRPWQKGMEFPPIKLIDWGLSKSFIEFENKPSDLRGTSYYMAPEILERQYDHKVDIWAAGVVFYVLISGNYPFSGDTPIETLNQIYNTLPSYESRHFEQLDPLLKLLLNLLMSKDINMRPEAQQVLDMPYFTDGSVDRTALDTVLLRMNKDIHYGRFKRFMLKKIIPEITRAERVKLAQTFQILGGHKDKVLPSEIREKIIYLFRGNTRLMELCHMSYSVFTDEHALDFNDFIFAMIAPLYNTRAKLEYFYDHTSKSFKITPQLLMIFFMNNKKGQQVFKQIDKDGNGQVDVNEFIQWMLKEQ